MLMVTALAKINLTLEVLRKRSDGYHEIHSVLQAINLCDTLQLEESREIVIRCDNPEWSAEKSLVSAAVDLLKKATGYREGVTVKVAKHIPMLAGLGGDSSTAAAMLCGLNKLWSLGLSPEKLHRLAAQLGSDVSFFLYCGTALVEGRGEIVTPLPSFPRMWVVLVLPDIAVAPGKTARMYAALKPGHFTDGRITDKLVETLHKATTFESTMIFNTFENVAFSSYSGLSVYKEHLIKMGAPQVHLAGSGPTLYSLFEDREEAEEIYNRCKDQSMKVYLAETS